MQPPQRYSHSFNGSFQKTEIPLPIIESKLKKGELILQPMEPSEVRDKHSCKLQEIYLEILEFQKMKSYLSIYGYLFIYVYGIIYRIHH